MTHTPNHRPKNKKRAAWLAPTPTNLSLTLLGLAGLVAGCGPVEALTKNVSAQAQPTATSTPTATPVLPSPTATPTQTQTPSPTATATATPSPTPSATATPLPTATPWPTPAAWQPTPLALPTITPVPVIPTATRLVVQGVSPVNYSPPDGVDVFGAVVLRWEYYGQLAEDEFFDIKIKPLGSQDSIFVDWSKTKEYKLRPWSWWEPGLYTWQIGIVKGRLEGKTKHFIADTGRDSQPFIIKWQAAGHGGGGDSGGGGGGSSSGGGGSSGGS